MSKTYKVSGMTCGGCAASVERAIKNADPKAGVKIDLPTGKVTVDGVESDAVVQKAVEGAGFGFGGLAA